MYDIGVIGLGVMGTNISKNMSNNDFKVLTYDHFEDVRESRLIELDEYNVDIASDVEIFIKNLKTPRNVLLLVKSGEVTDNTIHSILPLLDEGDTIIDGGNENFEITIRRNKELSERNINYLGMGVSGGEEGALNGPSLMPGGQKSAYDNVAPILKKIAAKAKDGAPCVNYIGPDGSGHYVKMVHNGIEYADMELIAEAYFFMKYGLGMPNEEMSDVFLKWNDGPLNSYLIEITAVILKFKDKEDLSSIDYILDKAGQKGTGRWTGIEGLKLGVPLSMITESVFMRALSSLVSERLSVYQSYNQAVKPIDSYDKENILKQLHNALYMNKILAYQQGFRLLKEASNEYQWDLKLGEISMLWREGCIIRAQFLESINEAYEKNPSLENLILDDYFKSVINENVKDLREIISIAVKHEIPMPAFFSGISYFDTIKLKRVSSNMIQAQRDYFGAHTYERLDKEGIFHTEWK